MAREWAIVLDAVSSAAAGELGELLAADGVDVEVEESQARVWCFAHDEENAVATKDRVLAVVGRIARPMLQVPPMLRVWSESHYRYVDPDAPEEDPDTRNVWIDSELTPDEVRWRVRLELESVFEFRRVRRQLPALRRPVIGTGDRHIDLGARDSVDASLVAGHASSLLGVASASASEIHGRLKRWLVRQELAGNYAVGADGSGPSYSFDVGGGGHGGGGGDGGGGHGGGGHGGH